MNVVGLVVAGGAGQRLGADVPKAFVALDGRNLLAHAVQHLRDGGITRLVIVAPAGWEDTALEAVGPGDDVVTGGATRTASVAAGLAALADDVTHVAVHDAARPLVPGTVVADTVDAVLDDDRVVAAAPGLAVPDTLKRVADDRVVATIDRSMLVAIQTPQVFPVDVLRRAHEHAGDTTDDLALVEDLVADGILAGRVAITAGSPLALKVTTPDDLVIARALARDLQ